MRMSLLLLAVALGALALIACGGSAPDQPPAQPVAAPVIQVPTVDPGDTEIQSHLATKVLEVGTQRVAFLLNTQKALIKAPQVRISVGAVDGSAPTTEVTADYKRVAVRCARFVRGSVRFPKLQVTIG